jgi:hypothetical protein
MRLKDASIHNTAAQFRTILTEFGREGKGSVIARAKVSDF